MGVRRTIGKLAKEAGVGVETVRFYERKGLIDQPLSAEGYRDYGDETLAAVRYIKIAQSMGFSLADVAKLRGKLGRGFRLLRGRQGDGAAPPRDDRGRNRGTAPPPELN